MRRLSGGRKFQWPWCLNGRKFQWPWCCFFPAVAMGGYLFWLSDASCHVSWPFTITFPLYFLNSNISMALTLLVFGSVLDLVELCGYSWLRNALSQCGRKFQWRALIVFRVVEMGGCSFWLSDASVHVSWSYTIASWKVSFLPWLITSEDDFFGTVYFYTAPAVRSRQIKPHAQSLVLSNSLTA